MTLVSSDLLLSKLHSLLLQQPGQVSAAAQLSISSLLPPPSPLLTSLVRAACYIDLVTSRSDAATQTAACQLACHQTGSCQLGCHQTGSCQLGCHQTGNCQLDSPKTVSCQQDSHPTDNCPTVTHPPVTSAEKHRHAELPPRHHKKRKHKKETKARKRKKKEKRKSRQRSCSSPHYSDYEPENPILRRKLR